jgi:hypothetical protein
LSKLKKILLLHNKKMMKNFVISEICVFFAAANGKKLNNKLTKFIN